MWPTFALVAIIFAVWGVMFVKRFGHPPQPAPAGRFADGDAAMRYFRPVEMPVLFFALVPLLMLTHMPATCRRSSPGSTCCCARSTA